MKIVTSVSKMYKHRGNHLHRRSTKKYWHIYYYDEDGKFNSQRVNTIQALYYKTQKRKRLKYICLECGDVSIGLVKSAKEEIECPYCDD